MEKSDFSDERSSSSSAEMEEKSLTVKQLSILEEVDMHVEAIQSLVKSQRNRLQLQDPVNDDILASGNSSSISDIRYHAEKILKVLLEEQPNLPSSLPSHSLQNIMNQAENVSIDVTNACERALNNSVVLRIIMNYLNTQDLLRCRRVCKTWEEEATIELSSSLPQISMYFPWEYTKEKYVREEGGTLEEFTEICYGDPRRKFPCSEYTFNFSFEDTNTGVPHPSLSNFLSNHGHHIKHLSLGCVFNSTSFLKILSKILFEWTPNLKVLIFDFPFYEIDDDDEANEPPTNDDDQTESKDDETQISTSTLSLKHLQEFHLDNLDESDSVTVLPRCKRLVKQVLAAAPNLQKILDTDLCFVTEIVSSGKIKAVDDLSVTTTSFMVPRYVEFSRGRPQLTSLRVNLQEFVNGEEEVPVRDIFSSLQLILESSRLTLKNLHLSQRLHFDFDFFEARNMIDEYHQAKVVIPKLENLEELIVYLGNPFSNGEGWILPRGFSFQNAFPRLKFLSLTYIKNTDENYQVGRTDNPFTNHSNYSATVEELTIAPDYKSFFHLEWIGQARELYPNVRTLDLTISNSWMELPKVCGNIWRSWSTSALEELKIKMDCNSNGQGKCSNFAELMDQVLTGFDQHACRKLREQPGSDNRQRDQELERHSSILDMSKLKLFKLTGDSSSGFPIFSRVSVIHAFEPMRRRQNLQVVIHGTKLEEMVHPSNLDFWVSQYNDRH